MKNKIIALWILFLLWAPFVWAQCDNGPCYTTNGPQVTWMMPAEAATKGIVAVTVTLSGPSNSNSHNAKVGSGTWLYVNTKSYNASRVDLYSSTNGGSRTLWKSNVPDGQFSWYFNGAGQTVNIIAVATDSSSNTTTDVANVTITSDPSGIIFLDQMPTNFIVQLGASGGGGSMLNDFTICQGGNQQHCINATHTPYMTLTVTNNTSGEVQTHPKHQAGNIARANESVSFSDSIFISANALDQLTYEEDDIVICSLSGPIGVAGGGSSPVSVEWAWTVAQKLPSPPCEQVPGGGIRCYMQYACTPDSSPPDYRPVQIFTLQFGTVDMPDYWLSGNLCFSIFGAPYLCPGSQIAGGIPGSGNWWQFVLAPGIPWTNKPFECTKASAGKGVTIPWPF